MEKIGAKARRISIPLYKSFTSSTYLLERFCDFFSLTFA